MAGPKEGQNANQSTDQAGNPTVIRNLDNNTDRNEEITESRNAGNVKRKISVYQQAALMHPRIAPAQAKPKKKSMSTWGTVKHGLFTALSALSTATVGGFFWLAARAFTKFKRYERTVKTGIAENSVKSKSDTGIIPGTKNERFRDPDVDKLGSDQPIIDDTRRVPLVFEREIFDDPNQKPTITLNFRQAREGSSAAFSSKLNAGHAFLTLKYTKQDPLTRENKRYQVTVGFGSQSNRLTGGAELLNGMFVPGRIIDDHGNYADVAKEYTISNQAMNRVILAVQKYETGGYQLMKRNCTTFVADMAKEAGLENEANKFMKEADFELEANPLLGLTVPGVLFLGPAATELGKYASYKDIGKKTYEYSRFGQNLYNEDEILRIKKTELNARMYGYDPSASGEALRKMTGVGLNSSAYGNEILHKTPAIRNLDKLRSNREKHEAIYQEKFRLLSERMSDARRSLQVILDKKCPGYPENEKLISFLEDTQTLFRGKGEELFKKENQDDPKKRRDLYKEFWSQISDRMDRLNRFYLKNYQGNADVNIRFQRMSALCANTKTLILDLDAHQQELLLWGKGLRNTDSAKADYIDMTRDSAKALEYLFFKRKEFEKPRSGKPEDVFAEKQYADIPNAELAVSLKVFGNMKDCYRYYVLKEKTQRTKEEAKEFAQLSGKNGAAHHFIRAMKGYAGDRPFSLQDYKYAFVDLPGEEKKSGLNFRGDTYTPAKGLQAIALERIFGGMKKELIAELNRKGRTQESVCEVISRHMAEKIRQNRDEYNKLVKCLYYDEVHINREKGVSEKNLNTMEKCLEKANNRILEAFHDTYFYPILRELSDDRKNRDLNLHTAAEIPVRKLPGFRGVLNQIRKSIGIQPLLSEKRCAAIESLQEWKKSGENTPEGLKKAKENVETLLKADACYEELLSAGELLLTDKTIKSEDRINAMKISVRPEEVQEFADRLLKNCDGEKILSISEEEQEFVRELKQNRRLVKEENILKGHKTVSTGGKNHEKINTKI